MVDQQLQGIYINAHMDLNLKVLEARSFGTVGRSTIPYLPSKATLSQERLAAAAANAEQ